MILESQSKVRINKEFIHWPGITNNFCASRSACCGTAYGEWGPNEIKDRIGFVPHGLKELSELWNAPMQDYSFSGDGDSRIVSSAGYILSALLGVIVGGSLLYFIGKKGVKN